MKTIKIKQPTFDEVKIFAEQHFCISKNSPDSHDAYGFSYRQLLEKRKRDALAKEGIKIEVEL